MNVIDWDLKKVAIIVAIAVVLGLVIFLFVKIAVPIMKTSDLTENYTDGGVNNMYMDNIDKFNDRFKKYDNKTANASVVKELVTVIKNSNMVEDQTHIITASFRGTEYSAKDVKNIEKELDKTPYTSFTIKLEKDKKDYYCKAVIDVVEETKKNRDK